MTKGVRLGNIKQEEYYIQRKKASYLLVAAVIFAVGVISAVCAYHQTGFSLVNGLLATLGASVFYYSVACARLMVRLDKLETQKPPTKKEQTVLIKKKRE